MYTMNAAFQEVAATDLKGIPKGLLPGAVGQNSNSNLIICVIAIVIIACCSGGNIACFGGGRRRRGRGRIGNSLIFLLFLALLLGGNGSSGRNINTNVINVETDGAGTDDIIDL